MEKNLRGFAGSRLFKISEYFLLAVALVFLGVVLVQIGSLAFKAFPTEDYYYFRESARMLWNGENPYARPKLFYPLYTVLWLFSPMLAGDWTRALWVLAPILFLHIALGRKAVLLIPFYPLLVHLRYGQVDGWLILPLYWLLQDSERLAPVSAALFVFKPQAAWALVLYRLFQWTRRRAWNKLALAAGTALVLVVPAFIIRPDWVGQWLASIAAHPAESCQNATLWGPLCFGGIGLGLTALEGMLALALLWWARDKARAVHLTGMLFTPILYAYDYVLVAPALRRWWECALLLGVSWLAVGVDIVSGGWGGAYALIPLTALALLTRTESGKVSDEMG